MDLNSPLICCLIGVLCGIISGFGIGGGSLLIVWMTAVAMIDQRTAQGINLLYFLPTALAAILLHTKNKLIAWNATLPASISGAITAGLSAWHTSTIDVGMLRKLFGIFLIAVGITEILKKKNQTTS